MQSIQVKFLFATRKNVDEFLTCRKKLILYVSMSLSCHRTVAIVSLSLNMVIRRVVAKNFWFRFRRPKRPRHCVWPSLWPPPPTRYFQYEINWGVHNVFGVTIFFCIVVSGIVRYIFILLLAYGLKNRLISLLLIRKIWDTKIALGSVYSKEKLNLKNVSNHYLSKF